MLYYSKHPLKHIANLSEEDIKLKIIECSKLCILDDTFSQSSQNQVATTESNENRPKSLLVDMNDGIGNRTSSTTNGNEEEHLQKKAKLTSSNSISRSNSIKRSTSFKESLQLTEKDIIVEKMHIHYGLKNKNPVNNLRFFPKSVRIGTQVVGKEVLEDQYAELLPRCFERCSIRVFCRYPGVKEALARKAFEYYCKQYNANVPFPSCSQPDY